MKNLFVPYEIALKLKEKGFDESCFGYYDNFPNHILRPFEQDNDSFTPSSSNISGDFQCLAPLYQQVIDWFESKKEIYFSRDFHWDMSVSYMLLRKRENGRDFLHRTSYFENPYEALNKAIEESLKLI